LAQGLLPLILTQAIGEKILFLAQFVGYHVMIRKHRKSYFSLDGQLE
jgi:hypothetical protein